MLSQTLSTLLNPIIAFNGHDDHPEVVACQRHRVRGLVKDLGLNAEPFVEITRGPKP